MQLPLLERRKPELETCAFCPKLSRAVCPVSNADGRETTTPWGKMSASYLLARGAVEATPEQAWPAWACTGCFHCKQACELKNDVAGTLLDARADLTAAGLAPAASTRVLERHALRTAELVAKIDAAIERARARGVRVEPGATKLVIGCLSPRFDGPNAEGDDPAADAIVAAARLNDGAIDVVRGCCGGPLRLAGDRDGFVAAARAFADRIAGARTLVVADSGCAYMIARRYGEVGASLASTIEVVHLVELAARALPRLRALPIEGSVRYHDACHLGRGLGVFEPPRAVLSAILGRAPDEFARNREEASCAGGGGLVPLTNPSNARGIAELRLEQHRGLGGGAIATTCAPVPSRASWAECRPSSAWQMMPATMR